MKEKRLCAGMAQGPFFMRGGNAKEGRKINNRKYASAAELEAAIEEYFAGICYEVPVVIPSETGEVDKKGRPVLEYIPLAGPDGKLKTRTEYIQPPSILALQEYLGISRETWRRYRTEKRYRGYRAVIERAKLRCEIFLEQRLASGGNAQGVIFNLRCNYDWDDRTASKDGEEERSGVILLPPLPDEDQRTDK